MSTTLTLSEDEYFELLCSLRAYRNRVADDYTQILAGSQASSLDKDAADRHTNDLDALIAKVAKVAS